MDGFNEVSAKSYADQGSAERAAFETVLEVCAALGTVFATVRDSEGEIVCAAARLSREVDF